MKTLFGTIAGLLLIAAAYLLLWPVAIDPVAWDAPKNQGYVGAYEPNNRLDALNFVALPGHSGPEDAAIASDGTILVAVHGGSILQIDPASKAVRTFAVTGGRPLGVELGRDGRLYVADAYRGLLAIESNGKVAVLADRTVDGSPILYADDLDITDSGTVYFSDASTKFGARAYGGTYEASLLDLMEHGPNGRILRYDPSSGRTETVANGLSFANGVALSEDESFLLIAETGTYSVLKHWLTGDRAGETETIIANLPGFPDNLNRGEDGTYWLGLVSPRSDPVDALSDKPFVRKLVQRLPAALRPKAQRYGFVLRIDGDGTVLETLQGPDGAYALTTGAVESPDGRLVVTSLTEPRIGFLQSGWRK